MNCFLLQEKYRDYEIRLGRPLLNPIERIGRHITSVFPHYEYDRPLGVSAIVLLRDEPMAYESVNQILPLVDEVVVVDSSDGITDLPGDERINYVHTPPEQDSQFKIGMLLSHYHWLLRWDGDFTVTDETQCFIERLRRIKEGYWQIKSMVANVHDNHIDYLQKESYAFTFHPCVFTANYSLLKRFTDVISKFRGGLPGRICYGMLPFFFRQLDIDMVYAFHHYKNKSSKRLREREFQAEWSMLSDLNRSYFNGFEDYVDQMEAEQV